MSMINRWQDYIGLQEKGTPAYAGFWLKSTGLTFTQKIATGEHRYT